MIIKGLAVKFGLNYLWGVANYFAGVASGAFVAGVTAGIFR